MQAALAELPEQLPEILDRFFARDESYRTIGDALDLPAGTIASRISRCLGKLRMELEGRPAACGSEVMTHAHYDEEPWPKLLRTLPAAPEARVKAAQQIPLARRGLDDIVERAGRPRPSVRR